MDERYQDVHSVSDSVWIVHHRHDYIHIRLLPSDADVCSVRHLLCVQLLVHTDHPRRADSSRQVHNGVRSHPLVSRHRKPSRSAVGRSVYVFKLCPSLVCVPLVFLFSEFVLFFINLCFQLLMICCGC